MDSASHTHPQVRANTYHAYTQSILLWENGGNECSDIRNAFDLP